ncbi:MAG: succinylglutamate desuccinylase/aspartoacylase family protein [Bacteroidota bacterium]
MITRILLPVFTLLLTVSQVSYSQNQFQVAFEQQGRRSVTQLKINFDDTLGNQTYLPISIIKGAKNGPVFTIVAGVHGFEYPPIVAVQQLLNEIKPGALAGTLVIIPIANLPSFFGRSPYKNPDDQLNLNRIFPGKHNGMVTEQIASYITNYIIPVSDVFLDIHGGDAPEDLLPFVCYYNNTKKGEQTRKAAALAEVSGFDYVVKYPYSLKSDQPAKYAFKQAVQDGKVALSIESGKLGNVQQEAVDAVRDGVLNMLAYMKMYEVSGKTVKKFRQLNNQFYLRSDQKGILYSNIKSGDEVKKGDSAGYITDEFGKVISRLIIPASGIVLYKIGTPPVNEGETIMCIGSE